MIAYILCNKYTYNKKYTMYEHTYLTINNKKCKINKKFFMSKLMKKLTTYINFQKNAKNQQNIFLKIINT